MKPKIIDKLQSLGRKVEPIRQFVQNAPAEAARLREAVALTAGQLQQLRSEIQIGISQLRADTGDRLLAALGEIRGTAEILRQAGFEISGIDLELGQTTGQRLLIQLQQVAEVPAAMLRALASANPGRLVLRAVLSALERALDFVATVDLPELQFSQFTVVIGPVPSVRIAWRPRIGASAAEESSATAARTSSENRATMAPASATPSLLPPFLGLSPEPATLGPGSGEAPAQSVLPPLRPLPSAGSQRPAASESALPTPSTEPTESESVDALATSPTPTPISSPAPGSKTLGTGWRTNALDRFKRMPKVGK